MIDSYQITYSDNTICLREAKIHPKDNDYNTITVDTIPGKVKMRIKFDMLNNQARVDMYDNLEHRVCSMQYDADTINELYERFTLGGAIYFQNTPYILSIQKTAMWLFHVVGNETETDFTITYPGFIDIVASIIKEFIIKITLNQ